MRQGGAPPYGAVELKSSTFGARFCLFYPGILAVIGLMLAVIGRYWPDVGLMLAVIGLVLVEYWFMYGLAVSLRSTPALTKNFLCFHVSLISLL